MGYKSFFLALALAFSFQVSADQVEGEKNANIYKDPRLDYLLKVYSLKEPVEVKAKNLYRVQIISTNSREEINEAKAKFASKYPGIPTLMSFNPPNFKLRAGGFSSREDANAFLKEVRKLFPASFIVESHFK
ncbi:MAG: SPOR domain-containing protein [Chitinophagales bacterium]|nr:SPOR domain-containing protein [Chitinophagales bacterium]